MLDKIFGRDQEIKILDTVYDAPEAQFLAIYGRRRIGKTYLINHYFQSKGYYFEFTGVKDASLQVQLTNFQIAFSEAFFHGILQPCPASWVEAMTQLRKHIEKLPQDKKTIIFIDEIPWLATPKSGFLGALDHQWNRYLSRMSNVILVICGSAASWMIDNIIYDTGGLYGRLSKEIHLQPFNLHDVEKYLAYRNVVINRKQIVELYFAMGGVAKYLNNIGTGMSAAQVINDVCFARDGFLYNEFNKLYRSLFNNFENHIKIVRALADKPVGLTRDMLLKKAGISTGGTATKVLEELLQSGFILTVPQFGTKNTVFKLIDFYSLFYLYWIEPAQGDHIEFIEADYWFKLYGKAKWFSWAGHAFENVCLMHVEQIKKALGIAGVSTRVSAWQYHAESDAVQGAQIDLIIDRDDQCINLCEIKFSDVEFTVSKEYAEKLNRKKAIFREVTGTKKALFTTLITTYGAIENCNYHDCVQKQLKLDDLFG
jgi:AAA+ ATPase superfamily predicted ATPase